VCCGHDCKAGASLRAAASVLWQACRACKEWNGSERVERSSVTKGDNECNLSYRSIAIERSVATMLNEA
jgi:hypothetical protein